MTVTINGTTGVTAPEVTLDNSSADGGQVVLKSSGYSNWNWDNYSGNLRAYYGSTEAMRIDSSGNVGIGTSSPQAKIDVVAGSNARGMFVRGRASDNIGLIDFWDNAGTTRYASIGSEAANTFSIETASVERMRIDSSGRLIVGKTTDAFGTNGVVIDPAATDAGVYSTNTRTDGGGGLFFCNRQGSDGPLILFYQASTQEGSISVSGTTVSYNGGHLSRWAQWQNETGQPEVYRGTVLESTDDMCEWYDEEGRLLPNEQATKTIVSTTEASKAVAGVFDVYDIADHANPFDFYVAQSGDFVIRIAQGVVVKNGDLLESAGDGTARPQADDVCRSSTVAKVTSNKVVETYQDGSFCVPCILMIG